VVDPFYEIIGFVFLGKYQAALSVKRGKLFLANELYKKAVSSDPNNPVAAFNYASFLESKMGSHEEAVPTLFVCCEHYFQCVTHYSHTFTSCRTIFRQLSCVHRTTRSPSIICAANDTSKPTNRKPTKNPRMIPQSHRCRHGVRHLTTNCSKSSDPLK
jgi:hypothetical protein